MWNVRDLEAVFNGAIGALAKTGVFGAKVTGIVDGSDLWWLEPQGILFVVPAKANIAVTVDARAQATAQRCLRPPKGGKGMPSIAVFVP